MIIISLLGNAISQFKVYRCPRMRRVLGTANILLDISEVITHRTEKLISFPFTVVQMAEEYFNARDYGKVLT